MARWATLEAALWARMDLFIRHTQVRFRGIVPID